MEEKKKVKPIFGSFECRDTVDGITIKFLTGVNRFRIEPHEGLSSPIVITEEELNAIAKFSKGFRIPKFYTQQELDRAREEGYKKGREDQQHLDGLLYGTTVATTTTLEEGWILKDKKKVEEELSKLTTK